MMNKFRTLGLTLSILALGLLSACNSCSNKSVNEANGVYRFSVANGNGQQVDLSDFEGKVLLIVNTATQCGFTPQYAELQSLFERYYNQGLVVLDFPCNQFGQQAPGSYEEINAFCTGQFGTTFPRLAKIDVNGDSAIALYQWLKEQCPFQGFDTINPLSPFLDQMLRAQDSLYDHNPDIKWNFTKFLIDREGNVVHRFEPTAPMAEVEEAIKVLL